MVFSLSCEISGCYDPYRLAAHTSDLERQARVFMKIVWKLKDDSLKNLCLKFRITRDELAGWGRNVSYREISVQWKYYECQVDDVLSLPMQSVARRFCASSEWPTSSKALLASFPRSTKRSKTGSFLLESLCKHAHKTRKSIAASWYPEDVSSLIHTNRTKKWSLIQTQSSTNKKSWTSIFARCTLEKPCSIGPELAKPCWPSDWNHPSYPPHHSNIPSIHDVMDSTSDSSC